MENRKIPRGVINRHDFECNWKKATNFIPSDGEIIIYSAEVTADGTILDGLNDELRGRPAEKNARYKTGDGTTKVNDLPFQGEGVGKAQGDGEIFNDYNTNLSIGQKSHAEGSQCQAGAYAFTINALNLNEKTYILSSISGLEIGDVYSVCINYHTTSGTIANKWYENIGKIIAILDDHTIHVDKMFEVPTNYVQFEPVKNFINEFGGDTELNIFKITNKPLIGDRPIGFTTHAEGHKNQAQSIGSHAEGGLNKSYGPWSHTEGLSNSAGYSAHAEGKYNTASGDSSHAEGYSTTATGVHTHTEGFKTEATNSAAHAEGYETKAQGTYSHTEGFKTEATSSAAHAEGNKTTASGTCSHAEGDGSTASGPSSHAEGYQCQATGVQAHAQGHQTIASGAKSFSTGQKTEAYGEYSMAGGYSSRAGKLALSYGRTTQANGQHSIALGNNTLADGDASVALGYNTKATNNNQFVAGQNNKEDAEALFMIGIGTSASARNNGMSVYKDGSAWVSNEVYIGGTGKADAKDTLAKTSEIEQGLTAILTAIRASLSKEA